jgi:hypothetical protein
MKAALSNFLRDTSLSEITLGAYETLMKKSKRTPLFSTAYNSIYKFKNVKLQVANALNIDVALLKFELRLLAVVKLYSSEEKYEDVAQYLMNKYGEPVVQQSNGPLHKRFYTWREKNYRLQLMPKSDGTTGYTMKYEYNY